jgi:tetratricopeptide (TPR) repeat protein
VTRFTLIPVSVFLCVSCTKTPEEPHTRLDEATVARAREALKSIPKAIQFFRSGDYDESARLFHDMIELLPGAHYASAAAALLGLRDAASYQQLLSRLYSNLGVCRLRARRYEEAVRNLEEAARLDSRAPRPKANLGVALIHLQRYPEAQKSLEEAHHLGAGGAKLYFDLGKAYVKGGLAAKARQALTESVRLSLAENTIQGRGTALEAEELLAEADQQEGLLAQAELHLRSILARASGQVSARYRLARLLARTNRATEAAEHEKRFAADSELMASIQTALASNPGRVAALHWVADSYRKLGILHLAEVHYLQLLARNPSDASVKRAIQELRTQAGVGGGPRRKEELEGEQ